MSVKKILAGLSAVPKRDRTPDEKAEHLQKTAEALIVESACILGRKGIELILDSIQILITANKDSEAKLLLQQTRGLLDVFRKISP